MRYHAGRYDSLKKAESYASYLRERGENVVVEENSVYDVIVDKPEKQ